MPTLRYMIEVMEAAERGEPIQSKDLHWKSADWEDDSAPNWDWDYVVFRVKSKPMELHVNVYPDRTGCVHESREACLKCVDRGGRYGLFREVVPTPEPTPEPEPEPAPEPPAVEKRKPRERRINRYPTGEVLHPSLEEAEKYANSEKRIECIHMIEVLPDEPQKPEQP